MDNLGNRDREKGLIGEGRVSTCCREGGRNAFYKVRRVCIGRQACFLFCAKVGKVWNPEFESRGGLGYWEGWFFLDGFLLGLRLFELI